MRASASRILVSLGVSTIGLVTVGAAQTTYPNVKLNGRTIPAIPIDRLRAALKKYGRGTR